MRCLRIRENADVQGRARAYDSCMSRTSPPGSHYGLRVVIAGGGVAGLEALLALRALADDLVDLELLAAEPAFWYRPLAVAEPFDAGRAEHFDLTRFAEAAGAGFTLGALASVDVDARVARTAAGAELEYDILVVACGAAPRVTLPEALTFRGPADSEAFTRLLAEAETAAVRSIAFAQPGTTGWSLPLYELALMTAARLERSHADVELTLVTPEPAPLALFGEATGEELSALLRARRIALLLGRYPAAYEDRVLRLVPEGSVEADRVVAMPRLEGRPIAGLPQDADGFVPTDLHGRIVGARHVYAAGDITTFPIKQGGIAAQQADAVAEAIAAEAGADVTPQPFRPVLRGLLLTGDVPRYLRYEPTAGTAPTATVATEPLWWPAGKIVGRYLAPFLAEQVRASAPTA
jgi:sulfide:quinone oxidoreductase